jgi:hypothetical protein
MRNIYPETDNTYALGSTAKAWKEAYINRIYFNKDNNNYYID